jgi:hypothetical protein
MQHFGQLTPAPLTGIQMRGDAPSFGGVESALGEAGDLEFGQVVDIRHVHGLRGWLALPRISIYG